MAIHRLSSTKIKTLGDGMHPDGGGLYLRIKGGSRSWIFRFSKDKKTHDLGLGSAKYMNLPMARKAMREMRERFANGEADDIIARRRTFSRKAVFSQLYLPALENQYKIRDYGEKTHKKYLHLIVTHCAALMPMEVQAIRREHVLQVIEPLWYTNNPTAKVLLRGIKIVLTYAKGLGLIEGELPTVWEGGLSLFLKPPKKVHEEEHHAPVPLAEIPSIVARLQEDPSPYARALLFGFCTVLRIREFTTAEWSGVDLGAAVYTAPRTKGKDKPFRVPLSCQAVELVQSLPRLSGPLFRVHASRPIDDQPVRRRANLLGFTPHGIRSSFSMWCAESGIGPYLREVCLCHTPDKEVAAAYQQSDLLERRREVMQKWCDYCFSKRTSRPTSSRS